MSDYTHADCYGEDEVTELRGEVADLLREIESQKAVINQQATIIAIGTEHHDRVIARLLDGWEPVTRTVGPPFWMQTDAHGKTRPDKMPDGEAAIIRAHQAKT